MPQVVLLSEMAEYHGFTPRAFNPGMRCDVRVEGGLLAYPCTLSRDHEGPHYALESPRGRAVRERWEADREAGRIEPPKQEKPKSYCSVCRMEIVALPGGEASPHERPNSGRPTFCHGSGKQVISNEVITGATLKTVSAGPRVTVPFGAPVELVHPDILPPVDTVMDVPEPTKQRVGDQPLPVINDQQDIQSQVIADIEKRREVGIDRYGTALQAGNGRDCLRDAYEEAMDLTMYLKQCIVERDELGLPGFSRKES